MSLIGRTLADLALDLKAGRTTGRSLVESALEAIDRDGRAFTLVTAESARATADAWDSLRARGVAAPPFAGVPVSVKDLFDVAGQTTGAGSLTLQNAAPAADDAPVIARLRAAGLVIIGRTQMSEFAFTGLGLNPHRPQPPNPRDASRVPGGSSGGAAASVALGQAAAAVGTDTGGSVRIPAAFCGLVGFKPTQRRITRRGAFPLSFSLDSIGPIGESTACCRTLDSILADAEPREAPPIPVAGLRLGAPRQYFTDGMAPEVAVALERAFAALTAAGARIITFDFPELERIATINARGTLSSAEVFAHHRRLGLLDSRKRIDPNVWARIAPGESMSAADYVDLITARAALIEDANRRTAPFDAVIAPTTPILAPKIADVATAEAFAQQNLLALRNTSVANLLDRCSISLPMGTDEGPPAGLMFIGETGDDARLLRIAEAIETLVA